MAEWDLPFQRNTIDNDPDVYVIYCLVCGDRTTIPHDAYDEAICICPSGHTFTKRQFLDSLESWRN